MYLNQQQNRNGKIGNKKTAEKMFHIKLGFIRRNRDKRNKPSINLYPCYLFVTHVIL